jgi:MFS family permease
MYGDRAGRKAAMVLSFTLMGAAILGLALTPPYAQIGVAAPILLARDGREECVSCRRCPLPRRPQLPSSSAWFGFRCLIRLLILEV